MNAVDILTRLGERPLMDYTWGDLLASHINATIGAMSVTVSTTGDDARNVLEDVPAEKQLKLYQMTFPPLEEDDTGEVVQPPAENPETSPTEVPVVDTPSKPQRTFLLIIGVSAGFLLLAVLVVTIGVTVVTTGEYPDMEILEAFLKAIMDMVTFVASTG